MLPIILVHGIARFDILLEIQRKKLNLSEDVLGGLHYFKGIKRHLESRGIGPVYHSNQDFAGPVKLRAEQLKARIEQVLDVNPGGKVNLIAHSMGGLDARCAIVELGMADRVASLTTIGTPHMGTILADHVISHGGKLWIEILAKVVDLTGFNDLTIAAREDFNARSEQSEAANDVTYRTYSSSESIDRIFLPLVPSAIFLTNTAGDNDGLVPVSSQEWKNELVAADGSRKRITRERFPLGADHLNEIGWWDLQEAISPFFRGSYTRQRKEYENQIKAIYFQIASSF